MEHEIDPQRIHHEWDNRLEPTLTISSGEIVHYDLLMTGHGQVHEGLAYEETSFDFDPLYNMLGPVYVEGARPGHTPRVDILELTPGEWGWRAILPELSTLPDQFPEPYLRTFDLRNGNEAELVPGVRIPFSPFLGTMGVAPDEPATASAFPPHKGGGNLADHRADRRRDRAQPAEGVGPHHRRRYWRGRHRVLPAVPEPRRDRYWAHLHAPEPELPVAPEPAGS